MIVVKNRELLIPKGEQFLGTVYDNEADTRYFKIDRVLPGQIDISNFTFVADVKYSGGTTDSISLTKDDISEEYLVLKMALPSSVMASHTGNMSIQLRASDTSGRKWSTAPANMYIMDQITNPGAVTPSTTLTELEQLETQVESSETLRIAAETARASAETSRASAETSRVNAESGRASAETGRVSAETGRVNAESGRVSAETSRSNAETLRVSAESGRVSAETLRASAEEDREEAEASRVSAEAEREASFEVKSLESEGWAKGTQNGVPVTSESPYYHDNSKYYKEQAGQATVGFVSYSTVQDLNSEAKARARGNIDAYTKPASGIPSSDMTSAVQTSLGKADSSYQKPASGIPSTDMASAVVTSLGKADSAYQKPASGVPKTDLASGVQASLGLADTSVQHVKTINGNVMEGEGNVSIVAGVYISDSEPTDASITTWMDTSADGYNPKDVEEKISSHNTSANAHDNRINPIEAHVGGLGNAIGMKGWNQLVKNGNFADASGWTSLSGTLTVSNNVAKVTFTGAEWNNDLRPVTGINIVSGHKYFVSSSVRGSSASFNLNYEVGGASSLITLTTSFVNYSSVITATLTGTNFRIVLNGSGASLSGQYFEVKNFMLIDLTALFGSGNEPSTVADFRAMFPADYYPYCSGSFGNLLWTNSSPSSAFASQTISLDLTNYSSVLVTFKRKTDSVLYTDNIVKNNTNRDLCVCFDTTSTDISKRPVTVYSGGVAFDRGILNTTNNDSAMIPIAIYGIR